MSWEELNQIIKEGKRLAEIEAIKEIVQCPQCAYVPLKINSQGDKVCPMCGWQSF